MNKTIDLEYFTVGTDPQSPSLITKLLVYASSAYKISWTKEEKKLLAEYVYHKVDEMYNIYDIVSVKETFLTLPNETHLVAFVVELKASNKAFNNLLFGEQSCA